MFSSLASWNVIYSIFEILLQPDLLTFKVNIWNGRNIFLNLLFLYVWKLGFVNSMLINMNSRNAFDFEDLDSSTFLFFLQENLSTKLIQVLQFWHEFNKRAHQQNTNGKQNLPKVEFGGRIWEFHSHICSKWLARLT